MSLIQAAPNDAPVAVETPVVETPVSEQERPIREVQDNSHKPAFEDSQKGKLFAGKYKTAEDLEKGYKELTKVVRENKPLAPEVYDFDLSKDEAFKEVADKYDLNLSEDPLVKEFEPIFRENNITGEAARAIMKKYISAQIANAPDLGKVKAELGPEADVVLKEINAFVGKNLSAAEQNAVSVLGQSAEGIKALHKITKMLSSQVPTQRATTVEESSLELTERAKDLKARHGGNLYGDSAAEYEKIMDQAARNALRNK